MSGESVGRFYLKKIVISHGLIHRKQHRSDAMKLQNVTENIRDYNLMASLKTDITKLQLTPEEDQRGIVSFTVEMTSEVVDVIDRYNSGLLRQDSKQLLRTRDLIFAIARAARGTRS